MAEVLKKLVKCPKCETVMDYRGKGQPPFPWIKGDWDAWKCPKCNAVLNDLKEPTP